MTEHNTDSMAPTLSQELKSHEENEKIRTRLIADISKQKAVLNQDTMLYELVRDISAALPNKENLEGLTYALEMTEYMLKEKTARLEFFLNMQKKYYPKDYEREHCN